MSHLRAAFRPFALEGTGCHVSGGGSALGGALLIGSVRHRVRQR